MHAARDAREWPPGNESRQGFPASEGNSAETAVATKLRSDRAFAYDHQSCHSSMANVRRGAGSLGSRLRLAERLALSDMTADVAASPDALRTVPAWLACIADARPLDEIAELIDGEARSSGSGSATAVHQERILEGVRLGVRDPAWHP